MGAATILIVEDEAVVALEMKLQLQDLGYSILATVASGEAAIEWVDRQAPDIILMDVRLQGALDGIEAAEAIRGRHGVPIIFLTSHSDDHTVQRAAHTAPYGYLTKPYQVRELRAGIEVALTKSRMERQLREADRWFAHTLQCVADGVILTDLDGRVRFANPAAERLTGWSVEDAVGRTLSEVVRLRAGDASPGQSGASHSMQQFGDDLSGSIRTVLRQGRPTPVAHAVSLVARDGAERVVDEMAGPVNDDNGKPLGAVLVLRDASDRIAREGLLRASEERFRNAFDYAPLGMALVSFTGSFIQVNEALCRLLGGTAQRLKALGQMSLTPEDDREHEGRRLSELMLYPKGVVQFERRYLRADGGTPVWTLVSVSLMHEGDWPTCYLYQVHDLTQQKQAAESLAELASERIRREASDVASAAKSEFLSRVSHEMRTPLNAVIGFAQLLEMQQGSDPAKTGVYASHIRTAGEHLLAMVTDLLDLNRAGQGALKLTLVRVELSAAVDEVLGMLAVLARAHGVELEASVDRGLVATADTTRLRQVLLNLGSNAVKYNRQGGTVRFSAGRLGAGRVCVTIDDTGIGMTAEQMESLFQPFERLGQERTKVPGVGLGMVIARSLVEQMGGALDVSSEPRIGTKVVLELPGSG